jgi:hypothetical protein
MFNTLKTPYEADSRLDAVTPGQRGLYALKWTWSEVSNGGFEQLFYNSTGMLANDALAGAERVGAHEVADVIRAAMRVFRDDALIEDNHARRAYMESISDEQLEYLEHVDDRFFDLLDGDTGLAARCAAYVAGHPDEFFSGA